MKQGLQLRLSQQLAMTPQLQQAIRLLQLSTLELQQELQQALESNPLLEQTDIHDEIATQETQDSEGLDTAEALEQKVAEARAMVQTDPKAVANIIKNWTGANAGG